MILSIIYDVFGATLSVLSLCSAGIYLTKRNFLNQEINKYISKIIEQLLTPSLIFSSFIVTLDLKYPAQWCPVIIVSTVAILMGILLGTFVNKVLLKDFEHHSLIVLATALSMTTNIQLNVSHNLRDYLDDISQDYKKDNNILANGEDRAITYIMLYTFINTIARWTCAKQIIQKIEKPDQPLEIELMEKEKLNQENQESQTFKIKQEPQTEKKPFKDQVMQYMNPPIVACLASLLFILLSPDSLRYNLITQGTFLNRAVFNTLDVIGQCQPPIVLITLGSNLYRIYKGEQAHHSKLSNRSLSYVSVMKLIIMPLLGGGLLYFGYQNQLIQDPVMIFVMIVSFSTPSAINLMLIANIYAPKLSIDVSKILIVGYIAYIVSLPIVMILFFSIFKQK